MKGYTDLPQSKKLTEILPLESADTLHCIDFDGDLLFTVPKQYSGSFRHQPELIIPCWSLAALLDVLPDESRDDRFLTLQKEKNEYCCCYEDINGNSFRYTFADDPVDACVAMIEKLHELKML